MAEPLPWSHSRLAAFKNCPRQFKEVQVDKNIVETPSEQMLWGNEVHKHFEHRLLNGTPLPENVEVHEDFMAYLDSLPGQKIVEERIALDTNAQPCEFFGKDVWYRGVIDFGKIAETQARLVDHKTGKVKNNYDQLTMFAIHTFAKYPSVQTIRAEYYWTQTRACSGQTYTRDQVPELWQKFIPDLKQYAQAFIDDEWQPRQSGLCNGWCPVTGCEFWRPKRK